MLKKIALILVTGWLLAWSPAGAGAKPTFTSLPNPNVYPIFIIIDQGYLDADFIPARGGVSGLLTLMKSGKADITLLNRVPARNMAAANHWQLMGATIVRAVYLLSYGPVDDRSAIDGFKIISAFPGGSPDRIFRAGNFTVEPKFTDPYLAIQLFLKRDYDALLLPEPYISQVAGLLDERGSDYFISDMQQLCLGREKTAINAGVVRQGYDLDVISAAFCKAAAFIADHPQQATEIIAAGFEKHFKKKLPAAALREALSSGRLQFGMEQSH